VSKSKRELTGDEKRLWRQVVKTVKTRRVMPLADEEQAADAPRPKAAKAATEPPTSAPPAKFRAPPANRGGERKVRRGQLEIAAKLDLHGHTQDAAQSALARFLRASYARGHRTVIVITGVGRGGEGILKRRFTDWIADRDLRAIVSGYAPAHRAHGGAGAFYVFLKRLD
jgi:DNA-nicking Smr family endonuclease